jgi:hypothetical protein
MNPHLKYELSKITSRIGYGFQYGLGGGTAVGLTHVFFRWLGWL